MRYILRPIWALLFHYHIGLTLYVKTWFHIAAWLNNNNKKTFRQIGFLRVKQTFSAKNMSKEANIKTKQCTLYLSFSSLSLFPVSFSFVCVIF